LDRVDRLAAAFTQEINRIHQQGIGLDGGTGVNFFATLAPFTSANTNNTGTGQISVGNVNPVANSVDKYEIVITGGNAFTLNNLTTGLASGTFTFTAGSAMILAGGMSVTLSGSAAVGDKFKFSVSENASRLVALSDAVTADLKKVAAGSTSSSDGENARRIAALQNSKVFDSSSLKAGGSGSFTFDDFYNSVVGLVGVNARAAKTNVTQQEGILLQLNSRRESAAGVSIDEEMVNLIKFQQAFNASARMITTVTEMMNVLQNRI
jgi:flagellar hook-associated protein 1 FlgK